jgi:hypothetical protein
VTIPHKMKSESISKRIELQIKRGAAAATAWPAILSHSRGRTAVQRRDPRDTGGAERNQNW